MAKYTNNHTHLIGSNPEKMLDFYTRVMGGKIDKNVYTDYQGKRIYFCCSGCLDDFKKSPEKYLKQMEEHGVRPEQTPGTK